MANIIKSNHNNGRHEYFFEGGEWVSINEVEGEPNTLGFEYDQNDDPETYCKGSIAIAGKSAWDYDGVFELPQTVIQALSMMGYDTRGIDPNDDRDFEPSKEDYMMMTEEILNTGDNPYSARLKESILSVYSEIEEMMLYHPYSAEILDSIF